MFRRRRRQGQSIVEMSLLFPVFLLVIVGGIVDFGFAFYNVLALQQLANDAAAFAAEKNLGESAILAYIQNYPTPPMGWQEAGIYEPKIENVYLSDYSRVIKVGLSYRSKTYTPFYQTMLSAVSGDEYIDLRVQASYKIPKTLLRQKPPE